MHVLWLYFGWPAGAVWANAVAEPVVFGAGALLAWIWRDRIGRRLVAWLHRHHQAHLAEQEHQIAPREGI